MKDLMYIKSLFAKKALLTKEFNEKIREIDAEIQKYEPKDRLLKKGDIVYDHKLNSYKIVAVGKETYRLDNGTTLSKIGLTNWRGWGFEHPDWQYYYDSEHRDFLDFLDEMRNSSHIKIITEE